MGRQESKPIDSRSSHPLPRLLAKNNKPRPKISVLENSLHYFLQYVFIICENDKYRLVVIHHNRVLHDREYATLRGAKIAFAHLYREKAWEPGTKSHWSQLYIPGRQWLNEKLSSPKYIKQNRKRKPK